MSTDTNHEDAGIILALVKRFEQQRYPHLVALKEKVDRGERLDNNDIYFLERVMNDAQRSMPLVASHPEWHEFCAHVVHMHEQITEKALDNERNDGSR